MSLSYFLSANFGARKNRKSGIIELNRDQSCTHRNSLFTNEKARFRLKTGLGQNGGMDGTRTRDLLRDRQTL